VIGLRRSNELDTSKQKQNRIIDKRTRTERKGRRVGGKDKPWDKRTGELHRSLFISTRVVKCANK